MTPDEIAKLVSEAIAALQRDNWQDRKMTTGEEVAVNLAVHYVVERLGRVGRPGPQGVADGEP